MKLLSVIVSEDIFGFDDVGNKTGSVDMEHVQALISQIQALFSTDNEKQFKLETRLELISERYKAEQEKRDPHNVLRASQKSRADDYK